MQSPHSSVNSPMISNSNTSTPDLIRFSQKIITGKIIRVQPHAYVFLCNNCDAEFASAHALLEHCELHYKMPAPTIPPPPHRSPLDVAANDQRPQMPISPNYLLCRQPPPQYPYPYPRYAYPMNYEMEKCSTVVDNQSPATVISADKLVKTVCVRASASNNTTAPIEISDSGDEIYEIYDLGYEKSSENQEKQTTTAEHDQCIHKKSQRMFKCEKCPRRFVKYDSYYRHLLKEHGIDKQKDLSA